MLGKAKNGPFCSLRINNHNFASNIFPLLVISAEKARTGDMGAGLPSCTLGADPPHLGCDTLWVERDLHCPVCALRAQWINAGPEPGGCQDNTFHLKEKN
jgi:hypothetical protein